MSAVLAILHLLYSGAAWLRINRRAYCVWDYGEGAKDYRAGPAGADRTVRTRKSASGCATMRV